MMKPRFPIPRIAGSLRSRGRARPHSLTGFRVLLPEASRRVRLHWRRGLVGFGLCLLLSLACWLPGFSPDSDNLTVFDKLSFDVLCGLRTPVSFGEVTIIEMDQASARAFKQDPTQVWDRARHAQLLEKLTADGARLVVLDVFLDAPGQPADDEALARAMRRHGRTAIVVDEVPVTRGELVGTEPVFPAEVFRNAAAGLGTVSLLKDSDGVVRRQLVESDDLQSLAWVAAKLTGGAALTSIERLGPRWLNYYGAPRDVFPRMRYFEAFQTPPGHFRDQLVFIGGSPRIKRPGQQSDTFRTPLSRWDAQECSGVDLLVTAFLNLQRGDSLVRCSAAVELGWILLVSWLAGFGLALVRPRVGFGLALAGLVAIVMGALLFHFPGHVWAGWVLLATVTVPCGWLHAMISSSSSAAWPRGAGPGAGAPSRIMPPLTRPRMIEGPAAMAGVRIPDHDLLKRVGQGAYGEVWLARNAIGIVHAVKIIHRDVFESDDPYEREFRGITRFMPISRSHPGFVHVLHVGRDDAAGYFYCVMEAADDVRLGPAIDPECYEPKNLSGELRRRQRFAPAECLQLGLSLAAALDHLHQAQLIHRDIKPSNIIFVQGAPKLADIGLVTHIVADPRQVSCLGTRGYIAPEGPGTSRADIYSLGKVLYEVFTGLDREEFPALPTPLLEAATDVSTRLNQIVLKACEPDPASRYQSAAELHAALLTLREQMSAAL